MKVLSRLTALWNSFLVWAGFRKKSFREKLPPEARTHFDELFKMFKNPAGKFENIERLDPKNRVSHKYDQCRTNLWVVELPGIDSFLACELSPPSMIRSFDPELEKSVVSFSSVHLSFYDAMGDSTMVRLASLMNGNMFDMTVKIVDHLGTIIEVWKMRVRAIAVHPMMVLDYSRAEPIKWQLECECDKWDIHVVGSSPDSETVN